MTRAELARLFRRERRAFARFAPRVARAGLYLERRPQGQPARAFACANVQAPAVALYVEALPLPRRNVLALIRHELGHVADPLAGQAGAEQRADDIAEAVTGERIRYEGRHAIQTTGPGRWPRPKWIHR